MGSFVSTFFFDGIKSTSSFLDNVAVGLKCKFELFLILSALARDKRFRRVSFGLQRFSIMAFW